VRAYNKFNLLMSFKDIIAVCTESRTEKKMYIHNAAKFRGNVKANGASCYGWAVYI